MSLSNYPPGVTGNEPHVTGEIEFDPHAPFWAGDDWDRDLNVCVYCGDDEGFYFDGFSDVTAARSFADELNRRYSLRDCGACCTCGEPDEASIVDAAGDPT